MRPCSRTPSRSGCVPSISRFVRTSIPGPPRLGDLWRRRSRGRLGSSRTDAQADVYLYAQVPGPVPGRSRLRLRAAADANRDGLPHAGGAPGLSYGPVAQQRFPVPLSLEVRYLTVSPVRTIAWSYARRGDPRLHVVRDVDPSASCWIAWGTCAPHQGLRPPDVGLDRKTALAGAPPGAAHGHAPKSPIMFGVAVVLRLGSLALSIRNEQVLKAQGAREYGQRTSRLLALAHTLSISGHSPKGSGGARSPRPGRRWASFSTACPSSRLCSSGAR